MKKIIYLFLPFMALTACSTDSIDTEGNDSLDAKAVQANITASVVDIRTEWLYSNNGGLDQGKVMIMNDCDSVTLQFVELEGDALTEVQFDLLTALPALNPGNNLDSPLSYDFEDLDANLSFTISFADLGITHEDNIMIFAKAWGKWAGESTHGKINYFTYDVEEVTCGCEESFNYVAGENANEYVFTYVPAEDMDEAELIFTFAQAVAISGLESWSTKGQTRHMSMDLTACTPYSWTVTLEKDCNGYAPNNNVWTDFKVGPTSKKNANTPNITQSCN